MHPEYDVSRIVELIKSKKNIAKSRENTSIIKESSISRIDLLDWLLPSCEDGIACIINNDSKIGWIKNKIDFDRAIEAWKNNNLQKLEFTCINKAGNSYVIKNPVRLGLVPHREGMVQVIIFDFDNHGEGMGNLYLAEKLNNWIGAKALSFSSKSGKGLHNFFKLKAPIPFDDFKKWYKAFGFNAQNDIEIFPKSSTFTQAWLPNDPNDKGGDKYVSGDFDSCIIDELPKGPSIKLTKESLDFIRGFIEKNRRNINLNKTAFECARRGLDKSAAEYLCIRGAEFCGLYDEEPEACKSTFNSGYGAGIEASRSTQVQFNTDQWNEPEPLNDELAPVIPFDFDMLPDTLKIWVSDVVKRLQCPADYVGVPVIVGCASLIGNKISIRPRQKDNWTVVPNLWGGVVGSPGTLKSAALKIAFQFLTKRESKECAIYKDGINKYNQKKMIYDARKKKLEQEIAKRIKEGKDIDFLRLEDEPIQPFLKRYIINDSTVEKIGEVLQQNPTGILVFRDELHGLLNYLDQDCHVSARSFFLEAWNGGGSYTFDRIGRGVISIPSCTLSLFGGIQPGPLSGYLHNLKKGSIGDDGLLQRFQLLVYPDKIKKWSFVDIEPNIEAYKTAMKVMEHLDVISGTAVEADYDDLHESYYLKFTAEAQELFNEWIIKHRNRLNNWNKTIYMEAHLAKFASLLPSLALIFHLAEHRKGRVGVDSVKKALKWLKYLESHANRIYSGINNHDKGFAKLLLERIKKGEVKEPFSERSIYQHHWSGLDQFETKKAVQSLCELGWIRAIKQNNGGRPSNVYQLHPNLKEGGQN